MNSIINSNLIWIFLVGAFTKDTSKWGSNTVWHSLYLVILWTNGLPFFVYVLMFVFQVVCLTIGKRFSMPLGGKRTEKNRQKLDTSKWFIWIWRHKSAKQKRRSEGYSINNWRIIAKLGKLSTDHKTFSWTWHGYDALWQTKTTKKRRGLECPVYLYAYRCQIGIFIVSVKSISRLDVKNTKTLSSVYGRDLPQTKIDDRSARCLDRRTKQQPAKNRWIVLSVFTRPL